MNLLSRVREQFRQYSQPKAISHRPDLAGREHIYRQGAGQIVQAMDNYADYATVYGVYTWVQKALRLVSENLAGLPVRAVDGNGKELLNHPISELFANINDEQTPADLWSEYAIHMALGGEAFYEIVPDKQGRPVELWLRRPDRVAVVPDATRLEYPSAIGYIYEPDDAPSKTLTIEAAWMVHDKFYNPLIPWRGLAPINAVREGITIDMYAQAWSKGFLKNNSRPDFAIVAPQGITQSERDRYLGEFARDHKGIGNAHLPVVLEQGVTDIKTFSFPPKDIEWLQQREFSRDEVGAIFGVPDELMGFGKDTYENFQTALTVFWTLTMTPLVRRRDITLTHHFRRFGLGLGPKESIATDLSSIGVLQEDLTPKVELARKMWDMGVPWNTLDQVLDLKIGPVEGGEIGYLPSSLKTVDQIVNPPEPVIPPMGGEGGDSPHNDDDDSPPPQQRLYLPEGAKEQAKRILKRLVQSYQDWHLRTLREGKFYGGASHKDDDLYRWLGDDADVVMRRLRDEANAITGDHDTVNAAYNALKSDESIARLLEVEAATPFFTLPRVITHEWYKALVLQLDDGDDEAEQAARMELEKRFERELTSAFKEQLSDLLPEDASDETIRNAPNRVEATSQPVREILRKELEQGSSLGVSVALDTLEQIGLGFDWTLANADAARWASQYSYELIRGINTTTTQRMQVAVADWFNERTTLRDLVKELQPTFGRRRAKLIAQTETTRAAREGSIIGFEQSGVVSQTEWVTVNDERVCPQCGPLNGKRATLRGTFEDGKSYPPAHPGCRCFVRPVVDEPSDSEPAATPAVANFDSTENAQKWFAESGLVDMKYFNLDGIPLELQQDIGEVLLEMKQRHNLPKLDGMSAIDHPFGAMRVATSRPDANDQSWQIVNFDISETFFRNLRDEDGMSADDYFARASQSQNGQPRMFVAPTFRDAVYHESVHYYHMTKLGKDNPQVKELYKRAIDSGLTDHISGYASTSADEFFAEMATQARLRPAGAAKFIDAIGANDIWETIKP